MERRDFMKVSLLFLCEGVCNANKPEKEKETPNYRAEICKIMGDDPVVPAPLMGIVLCKEAGLYLDQKSWQKWMDFCDVLFAVKMSTVDAIKEQRGNERALDLCAVAGNAFIHGTGEKEHPYEVHIADAIENKRLGAPVTLGVCGVAISRIRDRRIANQVRNSGVFRKEVSEKISGEQNSADK